MRELHDEHRLGAGPPHVHGDTETSSLGALEAVRLEWNTFIGIFENLEKKAAKSTQNHENKLKILLKSSKNVPLKPDTL